MARLALTDLTPTPLGEEPGGLPFRRLLAAAFRARYLVFATTLFGVLIGTFMAVTSANTFVSAGKFLFTRSGAESTLIDPSRATETGSDTIGSGAAHILNTDEPRKRVIQAGGDVAGPVSAQESLHAPRFVVSPPARQNRIESCLESCRREVREVLSMKCNTRPEHRGQSIEHGVDHHARSDEQHRA